MAVEMSVEFILELFGCKTFVYWFGDKEINCVQEKWSKSMNWSWLGNGAAVGSVFELKVSVLLKIPFKFKIKRKWHKLKNSNQINEI